MVDLEDWLPQTLSYTFDPATLTIEIQLPPSVLTTMKTSSFLPLTMKSKQSLLICVYYLTNNSKMVFDFKYLSNPVSTICPPLCSRWSTEIGSYPEYLTVLSVQVFGPAIFIFYRFTWAHRLRIVYWNSTQPNEVGTTVRSCVYGQRVDPLVL